MNDTRTGDTGRNGQGGAHRHGCGHDHAHLATGGREPMAIAEDACRSRGVKLTPIRRRVLQMLQDTPRPLGAYDVAAHLGQTNGKFVAPITVYRALDFLMEQGFVHRLESRNAFVACPHQHDEGDLSVFLICDTCGGVNEAPSEHVRLALDSVAREAGFAPRARVIEIAGTCGGCRAA